MVEAEGRHRNSIIPGSLLLGYELQRFDALELAVKRFKK